MPEVFFISVSKRKSLRSHFIPAQHYGHGFTRIRGIWLILRPYPTVFVPVRSLRLRIASGGYDCRRECACASWCLPLTSHHSSRKMICPVGRHFMMQPLRGRHTPSRHHAVCAVSIPLRASTAGDGSKALSYAPRHPPPPYAPRHKDRTLTTLVLSSLATSIIPPLFQEV